MKTVTHSGQTFTSLSETELVWPIEEYLCRTKHGPKVAERIARLNPNGKVEGATPKGWHPKAARRHRDGVL